VVEVFREARAESAGRRGIDARAEKPAFEERGIAAAYAQFQRSTENLSPGIDERWAASPVRYLLTSREKVAWERITNPVERVEFVSLFWQERDPDPLTTENEFRDEFENRVRFADAWFSGGEKKGSETDRGLVFALLGPPNYAGQAPLTSQDDPMQVARAAPERETGTDNRGRRVVSYIPRSPLTAQTIQGTREIWHYRRDRLPPSVKFQEVNFEFVTKDGYGDSVLERNPRVLTTLDEAAGPGRVTSR
jgi:GWxTD domain-containing protein